MNTDTKYRLTQTTTITVPIQRPQTKTRPSRGGLDEINPEDIIYGEYSGGDEGEYVDLVYMDGEILRMFSGYLVRPDKTFDDLLLLLRDDSTFYLVEIKEVAAGFAFKRNDIADIKVSSLIEGNHNHLPSCIWTMRFENGRTKTIEANYQSYFAYGSTNRPGSMTNRFILDKVLSKYKS